MSMLGNVAVKCEMSNLLKFHDKLKENHPEDYQRQLELLIAEIKGVIASAESGWL